MSALTARIAEPDLAGLPDYEVAERLNAPDPALPLVPVVFSCRAIAQPAVLSGELELLRIVRRKEQIPVEVSQSGQPVALGTQAMIAIGTLVDAVERDLRVDPAVPGAADQVLMMLTAVETMGLLSPATKAAILAHTVRHPSWAEANGMVVTPEVIFAARGRPRVVQEGA
jgi:hypothetical protein